MYGKKLEASVVAKMELLYPFGIYYTFHDGSQNSRVGDPLQCVLCSSSGISLVLLRPRCSPRSPQVCMLQAWPQEETPLATSLTLVAEKHEMITPSALARPGDEVRDTQGSQGPNSGLVRRQP